MISRAISSAEMSFKILVSRRCLGNETWANTNPSLVTLPGLAFCSAGMMVRMLIIPTWGLLGGSGRFPVQPSKAGGAWQVET